MGYFEETMRNAREALDRGETEKASVLAQLAIADRLDRLSDIIRSNSGRSRY